MRIGYSFRGSQPNQIVRTGYYTNQADQKMENADRERVPELFAEALALPAAERAQWLADACGGNEALRIQVERLLRSHERATEFIETPATIPLVDQPTRELAGERVGPYRVLRELGRGGMGIVYLAERADGEYETQVAIKVLAESADEEERHRFRRERQILANLRHPNIARLLDGGTLNERPYVVMEFIPGRSLREELRARGVMPIEQINTIVQQVCGGLAEAHARDVIHRDIKPENLIVSERDGHLQATILDFGIAKLQQQNPTMKTNASVILGTVNYMSPEQAAIEGAQTIDVRSDLYSLGMVIYELLTGAPAFQGESYLQVLYHHQHTDPRPPHEKRPDLRIPPAVSQVVLRALAKSPEARQQSAQELAEEFNLAVRTEKAVPVPGPRWRRARRAAMAGLFVFFFAVVMWWFLSRPFRQVADAGPTIQYRVIRKTGPAMQSLDNSGAVRSGDEIQLEVTLPFSGRCYLFFEEHEGTIVWMNPIPGEAPQHIRKGEPTRIPENFWIPYEEDKLRKQIYTAFYVPDAMPWSLEDIIPPQEMTRALKSDLEEVNFPYARFGQAYAERLLKTLNEKALQPEFGSTPTNGRFTALLSNVDDRKMIYHRIELWHRE